MNGLQTLPQWRDTFGQPTGALLGFMNAVNPVAKVIGLFPATWIGDRYGRKKVLYTGFALLPIGAAVLPCKPRRKIPRCSSSPDS